MAVTILKISYEDDVDDEISILGSTPPVFKSGATKADSISVDDYNGTKAKPTIDLTLDADVDDDVVEVLPSSSCSSSTKRRRFYKGESSNSKEDDSVFSRSFTCEICTDDKPLSDSFHILGCNHRYCTQCISSYVAAKLKDNITGINCPFSRCGRGRLEPHHCRTILPKAVFERWGDALCEAMILGAERFYCPFKNCSALLIDDGREKLTQSECPECRRLFCVQCKAAWHEGIECGEFQKLSKDERSSEDIKLMNLAKSNRWVRCPSCRVFVSRKSGCSYMRCRCGVTFCYNCGGGTMMFLTTGMRQGTPAPATARTSTIVDGFLIILE